MIESYESFEYLHIIKMLIEEIINSNNMKQIEINKLINQNDNLIKIIGCSKDENDNLKNNIIDKENKINELTKINNDNTNIIEEIKENTLDKENKNNELIIQKEYHIKIIKESKKNILDKENKINELTKINNDNSNIIEESKNIINNKDNTINNLIKELTQEKEKSKKHEQYALQQTEASKYHLNLYLRCFWKFYMILDLDNSKNYLYSIHDQNDKTVESWSNIYKEDKLKPFKFIEQISYQNKPYKY